MRSLSNLIKSGRVEIGVPIKVGLSSYKMGSVGKVIRPQLTETIKEEARMLYSIEKHIAGLEKIYRIIKNN